MNKPDYYYYLVDQFSVFLDFLWQNISLEKYHTNQILHIYQYLLYLNIHFGQNTWHPKRGWVGVKSFVFILLQTLALKSYDTQSHILATILVH